MLRKRPCERVNHPALVARVGADRPLPAKCRDKLLGESWTRVIFSLMQIVHMGGRVAFLFPVHREEKRNGIERTGAGEARNGRRERLEIKVMNGRGQSREWPLNIPVDNVPIFL